MKRLLALIICSIIMTTSVMAADWSKPTLTDTYTNFLNYLDARLDDSAMMLDSGGTSPSNQPTGAKRWNATSAKWEKWNGSAWVDMATSNTYGINISGNADTVDTFHASQSPAANQIPVTDSLGDFKLSSNRVIYPRGNSLNVGTHDYSTYGGTLGSAIVVNAYLLNGQWTYREVGVAKAIFIDDVTGQPLFFTAAAGTPGGVINWTMASMWHSGNDGAGSGLDADKLDGLEATAFLGATAKAADADKLDGAHWVNIANTSKVFTSGESYSVNLRTSGQHRYYRFSAYAGDKQIVYSSAAGSGYPYAYILKGLGTNADSLIIVNSGDAGRTIYYSVDVWE